MIGFSGSTSDKDLGGAALIRELKFADGATVECGLFDGDTHPDSGLTLPEIGAVNEFGSSDGKIPARPFMRRAVDEQKSRWIKILDDGYDRIVNGLGKVRVFDVLALFGEHAASDIRRTIDDVWEPPKALATKKAEGGALKRTKSGKLAKNARTNQMRFSHPLIWLGYMRAAIRQRIIVGNKKKLAAKLSPKAG